MTNHPHSASGRVGVAALVVLVLLAAALYLYSERAAPPDEPDARPPVPAIEPETARPERLEPGPSVPAGELGPADRVVGAGRSAGDDAAEAGRRESAVEPTAAGERPEPVALDEAGARLRVELAERMNPADLELLVSSRLIERLVAIVHSLDGDPLPLRFRPLAHVAGLPRVVEAGQGWRLPDAPDPRYDRYRALFDRFDADTLLRLYQRNEAAFEQAWRALGESSGQSFRERLVAVLDHLASFELPPERPRLVRPEVLYEYADPALEELSWGRKILIRVGPAHAEAIRARARAVADELRRGLEASSTGAQQAPDRS